MPSFTISRLIIASVGWLPFSIGTSLRQMAYQRVFEHLGESVNIEPNVYLTRPYQVRVGNQVTLRSRVYLEISSDVNSLIIGNNIIMEVGVNIRSHGGEGGIVIGDHTYIGPYTCIWGRSILIGRNCLIASHVSIYASNHIFANPNELINCQGYSSKGIVIEDDCWLGAGVRVVDGVKIGKGSVIGAGAVVTKDIPPYSIAVGIPAKVIRQRSDTEVFQDLC